MKRLIAYLLLFGLGGLWWAWTEVSIRQASSKPTPPAVTRPPHDPLLSTKTIAFYEERVRRDPQGALSFSHLAGWYLRRHRETGDIADVLRAEKAARRSLAIRTHHNAPAWNQLALSLMTRHRFPEALAAARRAAAVEPDSAQAAYIEAEASLEMGNYDAAASVLRRAATFAKDPYGEALRARLLEINGKPLPALDAYRRAERDAERDANMPRETVAWFSLRVGNCLAALGRADEAERSYRKALELFPDDYRTLTALARLCAGRGQWQEAIAWGQKAAKIEPAQETLALLGDAYAALGNRAEAERQYQLVEGNGGEAHTHDRQHALFHADHGRNLDEALSLARRELKTRRDIYGYDTLAWVCYKKGLLDEAHTLMQRALARGTQDASLFYHAGVIAHARGDRSGAKAYLTHALALNPYFHPFAPQQARDLLARLAG